MKKATLISHSGRLIGWFGFLVILATWIFTLLTAHENLRHELHRAEQETDTLAIILERHIHEAFSRVETSLVTLRILCESGAGRNEIHRHMNSIAGSSPGLFNLLSHIDDKGNVTVTDKPVFRQTFSGDRPFFIHHRDNTSSNLLIGNPILGRVTGKWYIPASLRLQNAEGRFAGVLLASLNPEYFSIIFEEVTLGKNSLACLADFDGIIYSGYSGMSNLGLDKRIPPDILADTMKRRHRTSFTATSFDGVKRIQTLAHIRNRPMFITVGVSHDEYLEPLYERYLHLTGILLLFSIILAIFVHQLRKATRIRDAVEQDLRASESRLRETGNNLPGGMIYQLILTKAGQRSFVYLSTGSQALHGHSPEEILSDASLVYRQIHPADSSRFAGEEGRCLERLSTFDIEVRIVTESGETRWRRFVSRPHLLESGDVMFDGIEIDITGTKLSEEALRISEYRFRSIIAVSNTGAWEFHRDKDHLWCSEEYFTMLGLNPEEYLHDGFSNKDEVWTDLLHPDDRAQALELFAAYLDNGSVGMYEDYFRMRHADGSWVWVWSRGQTLRNPDGSLTTITMGTHINVTGKILAEENEARLKEQLYQSQKMDAIGQLAGGVAHDFNNALSAIMGAAELLKTDTMTNPEQSTYLEMILTAGDRAADLTRKLLAFSRLGVRSTTVVDVADIINDTIALLRHTVDRLVTISMENRALHTCVTGDASMLQNAFMNMGINAAHAMPDGGFLSFTLENLVLDEACCKDSPFEIRPGIYLQISICDSGCGMAPEVLSRIFEPFFSTKEAEKGTGLGMSAVYGAVQEHGGSISVSSEVGTGTEFHIHLPVSNEPATPKIGRTSITSGAGTILVIDDEELIRETASAMLRSLGYNVMTATNGYEGVESFKESADRIDLIMIDMIMPVMGGREAFIRLREIRPGIPILIASGFADEEDMIEMKQQGSCGFLTKPFRKADLAEMIFQVLNS